MAGYSGYSMSNNAVSAYEDGEMPLSKWTKQAIFDYICDNLANGDVLVEDFISHKCTLEFLRRELLSYEGWHHTSKFYNKTEFYSVNLDYCEELMSNENELMYFHGLWQAHKDYQKIEKFIKKMMKLKEGTILTHNGKTYTRVYPSTASKGLMYWFYLENEEGKIIEVHMKFDNHGNLSVEEKFWKKVEIEEEK